MKHAKLLCALAGAWSLLFTSCAPTTREVQAWRDGSYRGRLKRTMTVAVLTEPLMRNFIEQEFVLQLKDRGVEGVASNKAVPAGTARSKDAVRSTLRDMGIGTLLVVKFVDQRYVDRATGGGSGYLPAGYGAGWEGIYDDSFSSIDLPVTQYSLDILTIQMNVYDVDEGKLIYSAISNTYIEGAKEKAVQPFVEAMVKKLADDKLL